MHWSSGLVRPAARCAIGLWLCGSVAAAGGELAYVTCQNGDGLSVLDLDAGTEVARWSVPGQPAGVAAGRDAVFTVSPDAKKVRRHDPASGDVLAEVGLDGGPIGIAHDVARGRLFVSDWYNARIWVLNADTLENRRELTTGAAPAGLALSGDGRWLASADRDADQVSVFDVATLALHARITVGTRPFGLRFAPDGQLFVANVGSNDVSVVDPIKAKVVARFDVGARPYGVAFAKDRVFVSNQYADTVSVVTLNDLTARGLVATGEYPEGIDTTPDGSRVVVANWFDNSVSIIDADTLSVIDEINTCDGPRAFGDFVTGETR